MKLNISKLLLASSAILSLAACEKESNFSVPQEGQLNCRSITVDYINSNLQTRVGGVDPADFTVDFVNDKGETVKSYLYAQMPEIVMLPVGEYSVKASYGENPVQAWDAPYYLGESASNFTIKAGEITDDVAPVECKLCNIRIKVNVTDNGLGILGDDASVVVKVGDSGELTYDNTKKDSYGYFRHVQGSQTIVATFSGTVNGSYVRGVTQTFDDAAAGNSYTINFTVSKPDNVEPGDIVISGGDSGSGIDVDATISVKDENLVVDPNEPDDDIIDPTDRPAEDPGTGEEPGGDQPGGDDPSPVVNGPKIGNTSPGLVFGGSVDMATITECYFDVLSNVGITAFTIHIDSNSLTPEELSGVGLAADIDLINPGELAEPLSGLGFPVGDDVKDQKSCHFDISGFLNLLAVLGPGEHRFYLTVTDAEGTLETYFGLIQK